MHVHSCGDPLPISCGTWWLYPHMTILAHSEILPLVVFLLLFLLFLFLFLHLKAKVAIQLIVHIIIVFLLVSDLISWFGRAGADSDFWWLQCAPPTGGTLLLLSLLPLLSCFNDFSGLLQWAWFIWLHIVHAMPEAQKRSVENMFVVGVLICISAAAAQDQPACEGITLPSDQGS